MPHKNVTRNYHIGGEDFSLVCTQSSGKGKKSYNVVNSRNRVVGRVVSIRGYRDWWQKGRKTSYLVSVPGDRSVLQGGALRYQTLTSAVEAVAKASLIKVSALSA